MAERRWQLSPARDLGLSLSERARSLERESGLLEASAALAWWALMRAYLGACHRLRVEGLSNLPSEPPFVIVANHTSHLDAPALASALPWRWRDRIFPVAAGDAFFETPGVSLFAAFAMNALGSSDEDQ
jgi:hypothetical protein